VRWISERSLAVVSRKITDETAAYIDAEAAIGGIPRPYNEIFIRGLLNKEECICCRGLSPETKEWASVAAMLTTAGNAEATHRMIRAAARLRQLREDAIQAPRELEDIQNSIGEKTERRRTQEQQLEEESKKLQNFNLEEVRQRETALIELGKSIEALTKEIWKLEEAIRVRQLEIARTETKLRTQTSKNARVKAILDKRSLAFDAAQFLQLELGRYKAEARAAIENEINEILNEVARRDYRFAFNDDFSMGLHLEGIDGPVPKSGGENQLMSLAFTAALVDFAKNRLKEEHAILSPGTVAPLVLDAPIGHLDSSYRKAAASFLPSMASQILLLLSSGHTEGGVMDALRPRIGRQYILVVENDGPRDDRPDDEIIIDGVAYPRRVYAQERSQVKLVEVEAFRA